MTVDNAQLFRKAADAAKRFHKKEPLTEQTFGSVWRAVEAWVVSQFDMGKGASIPNFAKLVWVAEPGTASRLQPMFVLMDAYARSYAMQCGRGAHLASTINRGWQGQPSEDMNFSKLAIRFSEGLNKDVMFACMRILTSAIGDIIATGQVVEIKMGVGALKARDRKVEFVFDSQYAHGKSKRLGSASSGVPRSASLPGSRPPSALRAGSHAPSTPGDNLASGSAPTVAMDWGSVAGVCAPRSEACSGHLSESKSKANKEAAATAAISVHAHQGPMQISGLGLSKAATAAGARSGSAQSHRALAEDVGSLMLHVPGKAAAIEPAHTPANSRPYGTDLDIFDDDDAGKKPRVQQRKQFEPRKSNLTTNGQVPGEEPRKGKRTGNFGVQTKALESAAERHAVSQHDQNIQDRSVEAAMNLRRMELDDQARATSRKLRVEQARLANVLEGQIREHHALKAAESSSRRNTAPMALISQPNEYIEDKLVQAESYRNDLDYQVMEKAVQKQYEQAVEQHQHLSMIADAEEDLVNEHRSEQRRVAEARQQMKDDWSRQMHESRTDRQPSARGVPSKVAACSQEATRASVLSPW